MKFGKFLSNVYDPKDPKAEMYLTYSFYAWDCGPKAMKQEWEQYLEWINSHLIGPPEATDTYTQQKLIDMNMVGIYAKEPSNDPTN